MNSSGIQPVEFNVLLRQDAVDEKSKGGLFKPQDVVEREKHSQTRGVIVAVSSLAFNEDVWPPGVEKPKPGDQVAFARHAGTFIDGLDGQEYRVVKDKDIVALIG